MVVLVEPSGPLNIGSVARLCANFDVAELRLVNPQVDPCCEESRRMAVHGAHHLEHSRRFEQLEEAVNDCRRAVGTCGRLDHGEIPLSNPDDALAWLGTPLEGKGQCNSSKVALVFGREDRGLSNEELRVCQKVVTLHSSSRYPSLNLSHAVAVLLHDYGRLHPVTRPSVTSEEDPAPASQFSALIDDASDLLLEVGFLLEHTAAARMGKVQDLLHRASIRSREVALLRGMVRQLRWAVHRQRS